MSGAPRGSSGRMSLIESSTKGTSRSGTSGGRASICASVRIGLRTTGPGSKYRSIAHALQGRHDVTEQDRCIELEPPQRLQGDLRGQLGFASQRLEVHFGAQLAVFRQIAARLAHDPDRVYATPAARGTPRGK